MSKEEGKMRGTVKKVIEPAVPWRTRESPDQRRKPTASIGRFASRSCLSDGKEIRNQKFSKRRRGGGHCRTQTDSDAEDKKSEKFMRGHEERKQMGIAIRGQLISVAIHSELAARM